VPSCSSTISILSSSSQKQKQNQKILIWRRHQKKMILVGGFHCYNLFISGVRQLASNPAFPSHYKMCAFCNEWDLGPALFIFLTRSVSLVLSRESKLHSFLSLISVLCSLFSCLIQIQGKASCPLLSFFFFVFRCKKPTFCFYILTIIIRKFYNS
jgi:hypothetical protein